MRQTAIYNISNIEFFKKRLSSWASVFEQSAVLQGTIDENKGMYLKHDMLVGVDALDELFSESLDTLLNESDILFFSLARSSFSCMNFFLIIEFSIINNSVPNCYHLF